MTYGHTLAKNPCLRSHEIYNFGRPFLGHHTCILTLSVLCLEEEKKIFKEIMHFHYITFIEMPRHHAEPLHRGHEIYNFGRPFLGHLTLSFLCLGEEKKIFKEIMHFHYMTYIWPCPSTRTPAPGVMKFAILVDPSLVIIIIHLVCLNHAYE